jgi:hypothetical protein
MAKHDTLPHTLSPRLISRTVAAAYLSISPSTFDKAVASGLMPPPKLLFGRKLWDVRQLDLSAEALPIPEEKQADTTWGDYDD